jgi:hypothetical protein
MDAKQKFLKLYANLPVPERDQVVAVINKDPYTWRVAYLEIDSDTALGRKILGQLEKMEII